MAATSSADTRENVSDSETWYQQKKCKPATLFFFMKDLARCLNLVVTCSGGIWEPAERPRSWKRRHLRRDDFYLDSSSFTLSSYTGVQLQLNAFSVLKSRGDLFYNTKFSKALLFGWI